MKIKLLSAIAISSLCTFSIAQAHGVMLKLGFSKRPSFCEYKLPPESTPYKPCSDFKITKLYGFKHGVLIIPNKSVVIPSSLLIGYARNKACHIAFHTTNDEPHLIGSTDSEKLACSQSESDKKSFSLKLMR